MHSDLESRSGRLSRRSLLNATTLGAIGLGAAALIGCGGDDSADGGDGSGETSSVS